MKWNEILWLERNWAFDVGKFQSLKPWDIHSSWSIYHASFKFSSRNGTMQRFNGLWLLDSAILDWLSMKAFVSCNSLSLRSRDVLSVIIQYFKNKSRFVKNGDTITEGHAILYTVSGKNCPPKHVEITLWIENVSDYFSLYHEKPSICNVHVKFHDN